MRTKGMNTGVRLLFASCWMLACLLVACAGKKPQQEAAEAKPLRLLYWNIQNGMWSGQGDNYDAFVRWVNQQAPDICVWCEAQTIYTTGTADPMEPAERYLVDHWPDLAKRYGHSYWYLGGHRDNYPQVITSKYPIENVARIVGAEPDSVVTHGAGWARIAIGKDTLNLVSLHTWPQAYAFRAEDQEASKEAHGGDKYRRMEMEYIVRHTYGSLPDAEGKHWLMMGDFNSRSRVDNATYRYPEDDTRFLVHDYIQASTSYVDIIAQKYPGQFKTTTGGEARIDFVYCTPALYESIVEADVITDDYTRPVRDPRKLSNFWHPSDHRPILVTFDLNKLP